MVPYWPNQVWFPVLFKMLIDIPILITSRKNLLKLPQYPELVHPMWRKIDIVVCHLAGSSQKAMEFQRKLKTVNKEKICWASTAIHTVLSSTECWSLSGNHQNRYWVFNKLFSYWSRLLICKYCQICFIHYNQNWEWDTIWGIALSM